MTKTNKTYTRPIRNALNDLKDSIRSQYPKSTFAVRRSADDPDAIHLVTTVDIEDPEDVLDIVMDRLIAYQIEEHLPIHVIPVRPHGRITNTEEITFVLQEEPHRDFPQL